MNKLVKYSLIGLIILATVFFALSILTSKYMLILLVLTGIIIGMFVLYYKNYKRDLEKLDEYDKAKQVQERRKQFRVIK
jgi:uncharacterized membrane protein (DUF106 family)